MSVPKRGPGRELTMQDNTHLGRCLLTLFVYSSAVRSSAWTAQVTKVGGSMPLVGKFPTARAHRHYM